MILPRPVIQNLQVIKDYIAIRFTKNEPVEFCPPLKYANVKGLQFYELENDYIILLKGKKALYVGIPAFYCHVTKDIGLINDPDVTASQWLLSGIDGRMNVDRLCEAWAMNGELIPKKDEIGKRLTTILKEANQAITVVNDAETMAALDLINIHLQPYNTYMVALMMNSGVK